MILVQFDVLLKLWWMRQDIMMLLLSILVVTEAGREISPKQCSALKKCFLQDMMSTTIARQQFVIRPSA